MSEDSPSPVQSQFFEVTFEPPIPVKPKEIRMRADIDIGGFVEVTVRGYLLEMHGNYIAVSVGLAERMRFKIYDKKYRLLEVPDAPVPPSTD